MCCKGILQAALFFTEFLLHIVGLFLETVNQDFSICFKGQNDFSKSGYKACRQHKYNDDWQLWCSLAVKKVTLKWKEYCT